MMVVGIHAFALKSCATAVVCKSKNICFDNQKFYPLSRGVKVLKFIAHRCVANLSLSLDSYSFYQFFFFLLLFCWIGSWRSVTNKNTFSIQLSKVVSDGTTVPLRFLSRLWWCMVATQSDNFSIKRQKHIHDILSFLILLNRYGLWKSLSYFE